MAIATALPGFYNLGHSVTPTFPFRNRFYLQWSTHYPNMNKNWAWEVKKIQDFCPRDIEPCHLATARCVKLWSLNSNLFFKEPQSWLNSLNRSTWTIFSRENFNSKILLQYFGAYRPGCLYAFFGPVTDTGRSANDVYTLCINGCQFKILLYAFKSAQLTSFETRNSFELSTQKRG